MALEADLPEVLVRSGPNPRSLLTLVLVTFYDNLAFGPKVDGFQYHCDLGFARRLWRQARLADLFR